MDAVPGSNPGCPQGPGSIPTPSAMLRSGWAGCRLQNGKAWFESTAECHHGRVPLGRRLGCKPGVIDYLGFDSLTAH